MVITLPSGLKIYYEAKGGGAPLLLLHGWGGSTQSMRPLLNRLGPEFRAYAIDLPGFGRSDLPPSPWGSYQYSECIHSLLRELDIPRCQIIAHSFGGRAAIVLAARYPDFVQQLVLTDSAGLIPKRGLDYYLKVYTAKLTKKLLSLAGVPGQALQEKLLGRLGSADYSAADPRMRAVLVRVVNEDLKDLLPRIKAPTLLVWGENDQATPLNMGQTMARLIPHSELHIFSGAGHYAYAERLADFCALANNFLLKDC